MNVLTELSGAMTTAAQNLIHNMRWVIILLAVLWVVQIINSIVHYQLNVLGIYPRRLRGLIGILFAPFLHGSYEHLFFNTVPLAILASLMFIFGQTVFICASILIVFLSGLLTWLLGRRGIHVGASSVVIGYWGYLLMAGYHQRSIITIGLALVCFYYFAGLLTSFFPGEEKVSWEGHLFGFIAGMFANYLTPFVLQHFIM